jgi:hypothetical protein
MLVTLKTTLTLSAPTPSTANTLINVFYSLAKSFEYTHYSPINNAGPNSIEWQLTDMNGEIQVRTDTSKSSLSEGLLWWQTDMPIPDTFKNREGYCVPNRDVTAFLFQLLSSHGCTAKEISLFIKHWLPVQLSRKYYMIDIAPSTDKDAANSGHKTDVSSKAPLELRFFRVRIEGLDTYIKTNPISDIWQREYKVSPPTQYIATEWFGYTL